MLVSIGKRGASDAACRFLLVAAAAAGARAAELDLAGPGSYILMGDVHNRARLSATCESAAPTMVGVKPKDVSGIPTGNITAEFAHVALTCVEAAADELCVPHDPDLRDSLVQFTLHGSHGEARLPPVRPYVHAVYSADGTVLLAISARASAAWPTFEQIASISGYAGDSFSVNLSVSASHGPDGLSIPFGGPRGGDRLSLLDLPAPPPPPPPSVPPPSPAVPPPPAVPPSVPPPPAYCHASHSGLTTLQSPATGESYTTECFTPPEAGIGGGWTRFLQLQDQTCTGDTLREVPMAQEMVNTCGGNEYTFSRSAMISAMPGQLMYRQRDPPHKMAILDFSYGRDPACTAEDVFKMLTSDFFNLACVPWYLKNPAAPFWIEGCVGTCNDNEHSQFNCRADRTNAAREGPYYSNCPDTPTSGIRFHYGSRDQNDNGDVCASEGSYQCWTGWTSAAGTDLSLIWNWDGVESLPTTDLYYRPGIVF